MTHRAGAVAVIGGGGGIGQAIARRLVAEGRPVAIIDVDGDAAARSAILAGASARAITLDGRDERAFASALDAAISELGAISGLVNAQGMTLARQALDMTDDEFRSVLDVNLVSVFSASRAAAARMGAGGAIVNISSIAARTPNMSRAAYAASKAGVEGLTRALAFEWAARGIRVAAIAAGYTDTPFIRHAIADGFLEQRQVEARTPLGRMAQPAQIASVASFLLGPDASYITGAVVDADGGWLVQGLGLPGS